MSDPQTYLAFNVIISKILTLRHLCFSHAQDSVKPKTTPASGASTFLQASSVVDLAEDVTQYESTTYYNKKLPADKAYVLAKEAVEKGARNWGRTDMTSLNPQTCQFMLSCFTCNKECSITNPPNFWSSHSKKCRHSGNAGPPTCAECVRSHE